MSTLTKTKYDSSKFSINHARHGVVVLYDGEFFESADSYKEAEQDIKEFLEEN